MKKQSIFKTYATSKFMFKSVWSKRGGKKYIFMKSIVALCDSFVPLVYVLFPGMIIDGLLNKLQMPYIIGYVIALCGLPILNELFHLFINKKIVKLKQTLDLGFSVDYYNHIADMDFELNESPEIQTLKGRAQQTLESSVTIVDSLLSLIAAFVRLILIATVIIAMKPAVIAIVIIQVYINYRISKRLNIKSHEADIATSSFARRIYACTCVFDDDDYAKELRLFNLKDFILELYKKNKNEENTIWLRHRNNQFISHALSVFINNTQQFIVYGILIYDFVYNMLPIGQFTIQLSAVYQFSNALNTLFTSYIELSGRSLKTDELINFMSIPKKQFLSGTRSPNFTNKSIIEFRNVSFKYPGSDSYALKNFNITISCSEKLCIVGENGSGKSTFIKLLTRLYFPTDGAIFLDGININEFDYKQYQELFAPVFQDYQLLFMSLRDNIVLSKKIDNQKLDSVYSDSRLSPLIASLKHADNTQVYKWECEDGFEPSGGEGQRIAIARALYHDRNIYLLDEPTAALDPNTEFELYTQFHNIIQDKSAILITHRLSAVQLADKVAVFNDGQVAEYGTHAELYSKGGIYTEMFDKQAKFYRDSPTDNNSNPSHAV
jgi:ATP-binding cassette subfamily B protein/ATP-binding cassette subfamily C protein